MSNDMSNLAETNDTELRDLVYQSLERDGLIARLKAQLRAAVFKTIEQSMNGSEHESIETKAHDRSDEICRAIVLDWLEQSNLLYTHDLFKIETTDLNSSSILTRADLVKEFHLDQQLQINQSILHRLIQRQFNLNELPDSIKQSIDKKFLHDKISDVNRLREHFRSLFSHAFDVSILDLFLTKHISSNNSIFKSDYEQICLKWIQSCLKILNSPSSTNGHITVTQARRSHSPPSDSASSSSSISQSEQIRTIPFDLALPTIIDARKPTERFIVDNTNQSALSSNCKHNTTTTLNHLKTFDDITNGHENLPIEYDDECMSHSQMSSIDDVTIDKALPLTPMDFVEDLE